MVEPSGSINKLEENVYHDETRVKNVSNILENCFSNNNVQFINVSHISEMDNCHSVFESVINDTENNRSKNERKKIALTILDIEHAPIVFHNSSQEIGKTTFYLN